MVDLLLIYPYFNDDFAIFKFPPLGIGYIASYVRNYGYSVAIIDCTFMSEENVVAKAKNLKPEIIGIYSMLTMKASSLSIAKQLKGSADLLIAGGPLPTASPDTFLDDFDLVVLGEGEETVLDILKSLDNGESPLKVEGVCYKDTKTGKLVLKPCRTPRRDIDAYPFPARELFNHNAYKEYFRKHHGYTITSMITSRGCPFNCDFCSRPVFGTSFRSRSPANIVDEIETILPYDYDRLWFADDIFPISRKFGIAVCDEIIKRNVDMPWECLCRADIMNKEIATKMKKAGCYRVFFGLESGNNEVLKIMNKRLTIEQARRAVKVVKSAGIKTGAFFILGYPGESNETMLDTIRFASSLPLDYLSLTIPYPIPGTGLYEKLKDKLAVDDWKKPTHDPIKHSLLYRSEFSFQKLKFGIIKAHLQQYLRRYSGYAYPLFGKPFEFVTDCIFKWMR
ncbi:MAG: B12-binding domain-containing radical SAM protein [Promethearchaeota archaeon]